jgi:hypothetical protein
MYYISQKRYLRQRATKYCRCEIIFRVWAEHPDTLPITSNGRRTRGFVSATAVIWILCVITACTAVDVCYDFLGCDTV